MSEVYQDPASQQFHAAWRAAGQHLQRLGGDGISWIRADLNPLLAEHLSFSLGSQLISVYIEVSGWTGSESTGNDSAKSAVEWSVPVCVSLRLKKGLTSAGL